MPNAERRALLLSGPQNWNEQTPLAFRIIRPYSHVDPLGVGIVSAFLEQYGFERKWLTMEPGKSAHLARYIEDATIVFISARHFDTDLAQQAIGIAQKHRKPTIAGGYGPTFNPAAFEEADAIVRGEAEPILLRVIEDLLDGKLESCYDTTVDPPFDLEHYVWPDRTIYPKPSRFTRHAQEWERGCPNFCLFCSPTRLQQGLRVRKTEDIIAEIEAMRLQQGDFLFSTDLNTLSVPRENLVELFGYLQNKGIRWISEGTIAGLIDDYENGGQLLSLMSARRRIGGCYSFLYGADDIIADKVGGSFDKERALILKAVEIFREYEIPLNLSLVIGLDHHRYPDSFFWTALLIESITVPNIFMHIATPYPGTPWGDKLYQSGRVFEESSLHFDHRRPVAQPKLMTTKELQQGYYWLKRTAYNLQRIITTARTNTLGGLGQRNLFLSTILSGLPVGLEYLLELMELSRGGYIDWPLQKQLDHDYLRWKSQGHHD